MKALVALALVSSVAFADSFVLKDGKTYEGTVQKELKSGYLLKLGDGSTKLVRFDQIEDMNSPPSATPPPPPPQLVPKLEGIDPAFHNSMMGLKDEWAGLREDRASIGFAWPVMGMIAGTSLALAGASVNASYSSSNYYGRPGDSSIVLGAVAAAGATTWLIINIVRKVSYSRDIEEIERKMRLLKPDGT